MQYSDWNNETQAPYGVSELAQLLVRYLFAIKVEISHDSDLSDEGHVGLIQSLIPGVVAQANLFMIKNFGATLGWDLCETAIETTTPFGWAVVPPDSPAANGSLFMTMGVLAHSLKVILGIDGDLERNQAFAKGGFEAVKWETVVLSHDCVQRAVNAIEDFRDMRSTREFLRIASAQEIAIAIQMRNAADQMVQSNFSALSSNQKVMTDSAQTISSPSQASSQGG